MTVVQKPIRAVRSMTGNKSTLAVFVLLGLIALTYRSLGTVQASIVLSLVGSLAMLPMATLETCWRLYGRNTPEAVDKMTFPEPTDRCGESSFSIIVPAKDEAEVLQETLETLAMQTHTGPLQIIATLIEGDHETIEAARAAQSNFPDRIEVLVRAYRHNMKPHQLNAALELCTGDYVGVIDAEDTTARGLITAVEAAFHDTNADVVQGSVQLMNLGSKLREWFCVHNVMEYFFWFSSRMQFQADKGFYPLGGNTVFIRRELLLEAGGWPISLTEDCALGVKLSTSYGAKLVAYYDPSFSTQEETTDDVRSLVNQRVRWNAGFGTELLENNWMQLPTFRQRLLAWYVLATPFLQALTAVMLPLTLVSTILLNAPVGLVLLTCLPYIPLLLGLGTQIVGLREFGKMYGQKVLIRHYVFLVGGFPFYQWVLAWAAARSVSRIATGDLSWWSPRHSNKHRNPVSALTPSEEVA